MCHAEMLLNSYGDWFVLSSLKLILTNLREQCWSYRQR